MASPALLRALSWRLGGAAFVLLALTLACTARLEGDSLGEGGSSSGVACQPGLTACGVDCVELGASSAHCGACGAACEPGRLCADGACASDCASPYVACEGQCVHPGTDAEHCGGCGRACDPGTPCFGGDCGCPEGTLICAGQCVDVASDPAHCGDCNQACSDGELCVTGACRPAADGCPFSTCGGACVDTDASPAHCGACSEQCATGQTCDGGTCKCTDPAKTRCGSRCVDLTEDAEHCGACGKACTGGFPCTAGKCECPAGLELCSGACVDTESDLAHCGSCGQTCPSGQTCVVGRCSGSAGDECTSVLAAGVTLRELAVFQSGKVPLMAAGTALEQRDVEVVAGKAGVFRVYVDVAPAFTERVLSARLTLLEGDNIEQLFHKRTVSGSSVEENYNSTFNIALPQGKLTGATRYVVEIVECQSGASGAADAPPRFPSMGSAAFDARELGRLKLQFVPLNAPNGSNPDISTARLDAYVQYIAAMYPVAGVDYTIGAPLNVDTISANGDGWTQALQTLSARHNSDNAPNDLYYYGLFQPSSSNYCSGGCTAGIGYVPGAEANARHRRVSLGLSRGNRGSAETFAHELGHNHGRPHSPCGGVASPDNGFPHAGGQIGWWGFETSGTLHAPSRTDIMGYCSNKWVSDYVYRLFTTRVAAINGVALQAFGVPQRTWRVALTGNHPPEWGAPFKRPTEAAGQPERADILDELGEVLLEITVYRTPIDHLGAASVMVPEPETGWHALRLAGEPPLRFDAVNSSLP